MLSGAQPWYFGWSNCNPKVAEVLRQHYGRPYFLPRSSENNAIDWIFMGGPGLGAHMHVSEIRSFCVLFTLILGHLGGQRAFAVMASSNQGLQRMDVGSAT